ncbi:hypothetical protein GCM10023333_17150 [Ferrimonas pelagia]|uniref:Uncharacterized protein n=1 Tax=Ferrimonas pelagia TaxID=1177826 RepID=A0ABP9EN84_9GAMM
MKRAKAPAVWLGLFYAAEAVSPMDNVENVLLCTGTDFRLSLRGEVNAARVFWRVRELLPSTRGLV